jgi:glycosyl transferase, family 25
VRPWRRQEKIGLSYAHPIVRLFPSVRPETCAGFPNITTRSCFLSHLKALRDAYTRGFQRILILEDDLNLAPDIKKRISKIVAELELYDWSIFYGGCALDALPELTKRGELLPIWPSDSILTSHFMGFRGPAIGAIATFFQKLLVKSPVDPRDGGLKHVDEAYHRFRRAFPENLTLLAMPELGSHSGSATAVHESSWLNRIPVVNFTMASLRRFPKRSPR